MRVSKTVPRFLSIYSGLTYLYVEKVSIDLGIEPLKVGIRGNDTILKG